jgi:WhiB family redox-sensing transcriptional regulator
MSDNWRNESACRGMPPRIFVPDTWQDDALAKRICSNCPVAAQCLEEAMIEGHQGVWGGLNEDDRRALRRRRLQLR